MRELRSLSRRLLGARRMLTVAYQVAGIRFGLESDQGIPWLEGEQIRKFCVDMAAPPDVFHAFHHIRPETLTLTPLEERALRRFPSRGLDCRRLDGRFGLDLLSSPLVRSRLDGYAHPDERVVLDLNLSSITVRDFIRRERYDYVLDGFDPLVNGDLRAKALLARMFTTFLACFSAAMIHSSGLVLDGSAGLFLARSGGGKSTVAARSPAAFVLSDDQVVLREEGDDIIAHASPWGRITDGPGQAPLGGLFLLEQAPDFELIPATPAAAMDYLWNEHLYHYRLHPAHLRTRAFELLWDACCRVPVYRMRFARDRVDWAAVRGAMAPGRIAD